MGRYAIDSRGSRLTVRAYAGGMLSAIGHDPVIGARDIQGEVQFDPQSPESSAARLQVVAGSLSVQNDASDKDRREMERAMNEEVLETAKHPEISFETTRAQVEKVTDGRYRANVEGRLSLHGVTRNHRLSGQLFVTGDTLRIQGEAPLRQTDFGIKLVSVAGGTLKIKDDVTLAFDLLARKAP
jgi:polyisoprenoid-binding protein YceI